MKIERISWDQETVDHISNHSVSPEEVEEVLFNDVTSPLIMRGKESKYLAYGKTNGGRFLLVVWAAKYDYPAKSRSRSKAIILTYS